VQWHSIGKTDGLPTGVCVCVRVCEWVPGVWVCVCVCVRGVRVRAYASECWNDGLFYARMHIRTSAQQQAFSRSDLDTRSFGLSKHKYTFGFWFLFLLLSLINNIIIIRFSSGILFEYKTGANKFRGRWQCSIMHRKQHVRIFCFIYELRTSNENIKYLSKNY